MPLSSHTTDHPLEFNVYDLYVLKQIWTVWLAQFLILCKYWLISPSNLPMSWIPQLLSSNKWQYCDTEAPSNSPRVTQRPTQQVGHKSRIRDLKLVLPVPKLCFLLLSLSLYLSIPTYLTLNSTYCFSSSWCHSCSVTSVLSDSLWPYGL